MPRLLVVDDEPDILEVMAAGLPQYLPDAEVSVAPSAEVAMEKLQSARYDLLLTDERMPGRSGSELLAWVRGQQPSCRRALMTAFSGPDVERRARAAGAQLILAKPFGLAAAAQRLKALLVPS